MSETKYLSQIIKGDTVATIGQLRSTAKVARTTKRQIVLENGEKFWSFSGQPVGDKKTIRFIEPLK